MNIAIIGYGVVGGGVHALLQDGKLGIHVKRVLDLRKISSLGKMLTDNIGDIIYDPQIDCVVEAMGGVHPAMSYVAAALRAGKHVVTSNKELMSQALAPMIEGAAMHGTHLRFGASVGGGVPWLHNLLRQKRGEKILSVFGVVNGTTNYILDAMAHGLDFDSALLEAQRMGYAEVDASADLDGLDAQRKCAISAALAFDTIVETGDIPTLGIASIRKMDIDTFAAKGLTCKLQMHAARVEGGISAYVEPTLLGPDALAAHTPTNHNCISLCGEHSGLLSFFGQGAGRFPTAETIVQDLIDIQSSASNKSRGIEPMAVCNDQEVHPYYIRTARVDLVQEVFAEDWNGAVLTQPLSVPALHALVKQVRERDPDAFFAGVSVQ